MTDQPERKPGLAIRHRRSAHWELDGAVYFITWRLHPDHSELIAQEKDLIVNALKHFHNDRYRLYAYVVMNDHVHVIVQPNQNETLSKLLHSWKSFTANQLQRKHGRKGVIWQEEYFDRIIRTESDMNEKMEYILSNPKKRWPGILEYQWAEWIAD